MLNRPIQLWQADDKNSGGLIPSPNNSSGQDPKASGDEMPEWVGDSARAWEEILKLRKEAASYRTDRNKLKDEFEGFKTGFLSELDKRFPKADGEVEKGDDPVQALLARMESFENQQKAEKEATAKERIAALRLKIAAEMFGDKISGENKGEMLANLAARLSGDNEEALREDAKILAALLPSPNPQWKNSTTAASPGGNPVGETHEQRIARIRSGGAAKTSFT